MNSTTGVDVQSHCDSYTWIDGNTYTSSNNTATVTLVNDAGCDSVVTLDLTILNSNTGVDVQSHCDSYTWIDGNTYTSSNNTATHTLTNAAGCDSIITLNLTILNTSGVDIQSHCDSYTWIDGNTYTSSNNTATVTLVNDAGCDSVVTLDLTILNSTTGVDVQIHCDSYTWIDGNTYTSSNNTATVTLVNDAGCDSVVTLDLTILNSTTGVDVQSHCDSYTWIDGNTYTSSNNTATVTLVNDAGCDSVITLNLIITTTKTVNVFAESCISYTWEINNINYSQSGVYSVSFSDNNNCDSTLVLNLSIIDDLFYIPSSFSPNSDEKNDFFNLVTEQPFTNYELHIFNNWGELIFSSNNISNGWNGTYMGRNCQSGIYAYRIKFLCSSKEIVKTGTFTLIR